MPDFSFLQDPVSKKWVSLAPRRENRPDESHDTIEICPFCPGREDEQPSVYEVHFENTADWLVRVFPNKFPFTTIHEVIVHSPDHHKSFGELPLEQGERILKTYRQRYNEHTEKGQVYILNNTGEHAGESIPHPHSQLVVIPAEVTIDVPEYEIASDMLVDAGLFHVGTPAAAQWPDEVWFLPKATGKTFGEITDEEIVSLSDGLDRLVRLYSQRYGHEFPFNFYIRPGIDWYLRLIPRVKTIGGFEIGTGLYVNTHDPKETVAFLKRHWEDPDFALIQSSHRAGYQKRV